MTATTIQPGTGISLLLRAQQILRVTDPQGGQVCDLVAFRADDITEWLSNGRTFDYNGTIYLTSDHVLFSNKSNPMLSIVRDDVGQHDFSLSACSAPNCNGGRIKPIQYELLG